MPTVLKVDGFRVMIYTDDHEPAHVHVFKAGCQAVVLLHCPDGPPTLRQNEGFKDRELRSIYNIIQRNIRLLCAAWEEIHVQP